MTVRLRAYAKINLYLDVTGRRPDGYHDILSVMQSVSLSDGIELTVNKEEGGEITLECDSPALPCNEKNLAYRAAAAFYEALGIRRKTHIRIEKRIPVSAGLAGGSTDAAAVLVGLNLLFDEPFSRETLCTIGKRLGADIPFCIVGGTAEVRGIGERLRPLADVAPLFLVVAKRGEGVSTPEAYRALDELYDGFTGRYAGGSRGTERYESLLKALRGGDETRMGEELYNIFESAVLPRHAEATHLKDFFLNNGAFAAMMSGSGPSVFGLFRDAESARLAVQRLNRESGCTIAFAVTTIPAREVGKADFCKG